MKIFAAYLGTYLYPTIGSEIDYVLQLGDIFH